MGEVVMSAMGAEQCMDYTVLDDHVNLAARFCSYAAAKQAIVSEPVAKTIGESPAFRLQPLEPIRIKGTTNALNVFSVHRASGIETPAPTPPATETAAT